MKRLLGKPPKFRVGQVVWCREVQYGRITFKQQIAEGVGRGLRWRYNIYNGVHGTRGVAEREIRPLNKRERGVTR